MAQPVTLLLTRPRAASERFAQQVASELEALKVVISPLLEIEFLDISAPKNVEMVVFTSLNGVDAWKRAKLPVDRPCYCVGQATGEAARAISFEPEISGGNVAHLIEDLRKTSPKGKIVHVHGRHTRGDLVGALQSDGLDAIGVLAYEQTALALSEEARNLLQGGAPVIVPLFSPRSAAQFAKAGPFGEQIDIIAISDAAAEVCPRARVAPSADAKGMIAAILQGA